MMNRSFPLDLPRERDLLSRHSFFACSGVATEIIVLWGQEKEFGFVIAIGKYFFQSIVVTTTRD